MTIKKKVNEKEIELYFLLYLELRIEFGKFLKN